MAKTVLLVSLDTTLQYASAVAFKGAGFRTVCVSRLEAALSVARAHMADLIVLCHSFSVGDQRRFIESAAEHHTRLPIVDLNREVVKHANFIEECRQLLQLPPSRSKPTIDGAPRAVITREWADYSAEATRV